jgi:dipeptidyl aminopeptidase/acylaminoacyl peptidase
MKHKYILLLAILCGIAFLSSAYASSGDSKSVPLSLEEIVTLKRVKSVHMSPNGDAIAYLLSVPRKLYEDDDGDAWVQLHVVDLEGNSRPYFSGEVKVSSVVWSTDGNTLYFVSRQDSDAKYPDIFKIPLHGGEASVFYQGKSDIKGIYPSPDGSTLAFLATDPKPAIDEKLKDKGFKALVYEESKKNTRVWMLDLKTAKASVHDLPGSASGLAWAPDGKHYAVALAPTPLIDDTYVARDIFVIDVKEVSVRNQLGSVGKLGSFAWSPNGKRIAYIAAKDINDPSPGRLYLSSSQGGERTNLVPAYAGQVQDFYWNDDDSIVYVGARGLWTELSNVSLLEIESADEAPNVGPILRSVDSPFGHRSAAAVADRPTHPPEVYVLKPGSNPRRLTDSNPFLAQRLLGKQEAISYQARDGLQLDAVLIHPIVKRADGLKPLIMFVHGGPEGHQSNGWLSTYSQPGQALAAQGYTVIYPNYRGSTARGVEFSKMGQNDYAAAEFDDLVDAKNHLVKAGLADSDHTGISGGSYGGYASMWAASALSEHFAAAVAFVGISNQLSKFGTTDIPREMYNVHSRAWPWEDWMWMLKRSPVYHADKTRTPLLILAGDRDPRVHPSQSLEMYRYVKLRTDTPVRLVFYPGEKHGNKHTAAQFDYALRLERWMSYYLTGPADSLPPYEIDHAARMQE